MHPFAGMVAPWAAAIPGVAGIAIQRFDRLMGDPVKYPLARTCSTWPA
jgi:hypothetical protein